MKDFKSDKNDLTPKSQMLRVPTALIPAIRELSRLHRAGHTDAVLHGLQDLISIIDSNSDIDIAASSKLVKQLEMRLLKLESDQAASSDLVSKLEAVTRRLELLEGAISFLRNATRTISSANASFKYNNNPRKQSSPYQRQFQQPQMELQPFPNENLAQRLGVNPQSLVSEREKLNTKEFISWSRSRDPMSVGWEWNASTGLYHPIR